VQRPAKVRDQGLEPPEGPAYFMGVIGISHDVEYLAVSIKWNMRQYSPAPST